MNHDYEEAHKKISGTDTTPKEKQDLVKAHEQAEADIESDPDFNNKPEEGEDLHEGELARLEGDE